MQGSPLCDSRRFARTMENSFRMLWKKHCDAINLTGLRKCALLKPDCFSAFQE